MMVGRLSEVAARGSALAKGKTGAYGSQASVHPEIRKNLGPPTRFAGPWRHRRATLSKMNEQELHAYALQGLKSRLSELDAERAEIVALLSRFEGSQERRSSRKRAPASRTSEATPEPAVPVIAPEPEAAVAPPPEPEREVARVLPRRGRLQPGPAAAEPTPVLPPMPRLIKAKAS